MCGRYSQSKKVEELMVRFGFKQPPFTLTPRYNIAPSQDAPVIIHEGGDSPAGSPLSTKGTELVMMRWGLIPSWMKELSGNGIINARAETVAEKPSFRRSLQKRRCLILADGFFEWRAIPGIKRKLPMYIRLKSHEPFAFVGLWDAWKNPEGKELKTFAIMTTAPNDLMKPIHNRMPVILPAKDERTWLDPALTDLAKILPLLASYPDDLMDAYEVSTAVNHPANDTLECLVRVT